MTRKLTLFLVCAFEIGLILFVAAWTSWADTEPKSVFDQLQTQSPVSRMEYSLYKVQQEVARELEENFVTRGKVDSLNVGAGYSKSENFLGLMVSERCLKSDVCLLIDPFTIPDQIARDVMEQLGNWGDPSLTNVHQRNILNLALGRRFSNQYDNNILDDLETPTSLGEKIAQLFIVVVNYQTLGNTKRILYRLNSPYSRDAPYFTDSQREILNEFTTQ